MPKKTQPPQSSNSNPWMLATFLLVGVIVGYGFSQFSPSDSDAETSFFGFGGGDEGVVLPADDEIPTYEIEVEPTILETIIVEEVSEDDDAYLGDRGAPIVMIEFSDFQCPYCTRFYENTLGQIIENYIDTGKVKLIYRDYPLDFHANAIPAAEAAECSGEQGDYWGMHDLLFEGYADWSAASDPTELFVAYAESLDLNTSSFASCFSNHEMLNEVQGDILDGQSYGVGGTPSFFINGQLLVGAQPYSVFSEIFDSLLEEE